MTRMAIYVLETALPLILILMGGTLLPAAKRRELLYWVAEYRDRTARGLHERLADELDRLTVKG